MSRSCDVASPLCCVLPKVGDSRTFRGPGHHKAAWIVTGGGPEKALKDF